MRIVKIPKLIYPNILTITSLTTTLTSVLLFPSNSLATQFKFETKYKICSSTDIVQNGSPVDENGNPLNCFLPRPSEVTGKEYSNNEDIDNFQPTPTLDSEQNLAWDGIGGRDITFDYSGTRSENLFSGDIQQQVDGLANRFDALFKEVIDDQVWLLFSTQDDNRIFYENPIQGGGNIWAEPQEIDIDMAIIDPNPGFQDNLNPSNMDVDGLEVWGGDGPYVDDANRYSLVNDLVRDINNNNRRVSVFAYDSLLPNTNPDDRGVSFPAFYADELAQAIALLTSLNATDTQTLINELDVDALMVNDVLDSDGVTIIDNEIMWSIAPILNFDGGEIFTWSRNQGGAAKYLFHGGHLWNTAFPVQETFNTASENINALEAVALESAIPGRGDLGIGIPNEPPGPSGGKENTPVPNEPMGNDDHGSEDEGGGTPNGGIGSIETNNGCNLICGQPFTQPPEKRVPPIPEPSSLVGLLTLGATGILFKRKKV